MRGCIPVTLVRTNGALNGSQKPRGLCKPHLQMARGKLGAPVSDAAIGKKGQRLKWVNTCRRMVLRPIIQCGKFMVTLPNVTEMRWIIMQDYGAGMENMVQDYDDARDSDEEMEESAKAFNEMLESSKRPLHEHTELCQLDAISQVMALKAQFNLGRECYDAMMTVFGRFLPKGHVMPANLYQSDKILRALKMPYDKIHACEKGCVLFRLDYADLNYCPICKSSRYVVVDNGMGEKTQTKIPVSVLRYMPIVPRLQRLFMVEETARQMT